MVNFLNRDDAPAKGIQVMLCQPNWVFLTVCTEKNAAGHAAIPFGEHAPGEAEIPAQEPTVDGRFHGHADLQCRVLA